MLTLARQAPAQMCELTLHRQDLVQPPAHRQHQQAGEQDRVQPRCQRRLAIPDHARQHLARRIHHCTQQRQHRNPVERIAAGCHRNQHACKADDQGNHTIGTDPLTQKQNRQQRGN